MNRSGLKEEPGFGKQRTGKDHGESPKQEQRQGWGNVCGVEGAPCEAGSPQGRWSGSGQTGVDPMANSLGGKDGVIRIASAMFPPLEVAPYSLKPSLGTLVESQQTFIAFSH